MQNGALGSHATHGTATSRVDISGNFEGTEKLLELVSTCLTVPAIIDKLSDAIESDTTGAEDIAEIARHDPSLTSRILKLVNSSFYTTNAEIVDLKTAVVRLGFDTVKNLILSAELFQHLRSCGNKPGDLDKEKLWLHSIAVAVLARRIGINLKKTEEAETYFVAGMLHDIGKALLHEYANNDYMRVCDYARKYQSHLYEAERHILQITHCAIAGQLLERWKLPAQIRELIVHHHGSPQQLQRAAIGDRRGAALLAIADYYVAMLGLGSSGHDRICDVETAYLDIAGISKADIQEAVSTFHADFVLTLDFLGASELLTQYQSSIIRRQGNAVIAGFDPAHGICASSIYLSHLGYRVLHVDNFNEFPRALSSSKPKVVVVYEYTVPKDERDTLMEVIKLSGGVERLALIGDGETAKRKNPGIPLFAASAKASTSASVLGA